MLEQIINDIKNLSNEKNMAKISKTEINLEYYGVAIGDLKKLVSKYKINKNNELANELFQTKIYDAQQLACIICNPLTLDKEVLDNWCDTTTYYPLAELRLAYVCAEYPDYEYFMKKFKAIDDDYHQSLYYIVIYGRVAMDPEYDRKLVDETIKYIEKNFSKIDYINTKRYMVMLIMIIGMQVPGYAEPMVKLYEKLDHETGFSKEKGCAYPNAKAMIESAVKNNRLSKKRTYCRC